MPAVTARRLLAAAALLAAPAALAPRAAGAQVAAPAAAVKPVSFGVVAGASVPLGDFADGFATGFGLDVVAHLRMPTLPVSFRADVGVQQYAPQEKAKALIDNVRILGASANAVYTFPMVASAAVRPYIIGGVGVYNVRLNAKKSGGIDISDSETKPGFNAGAGFEIPLTGITGFAEARYHTVLTSDESTNYFPIRFGIRF